MKALFLTLLAVNVLYLGWRLWIVPPAPPPALVEAENVPRLVLVGEDAAALETAMSSADGRPARDAPAPDEQVRLPAGSDASRSATGTDASQSARAAGDESSARATGGGSSARATGDESSARATRGESSARATGDASESARATGGASQSARATGGDNQGAASAARTTSTESAGADGGPAPLEVAINLSDRRCVTLGPFLNLREATEATAKLNEVGLSPSQRLAESQVWFGHWVHLPSLPTRAAAIEIVEGLRAQGVSDIYIEPSGPFANSISLGVFSDSAHAETRAGQIRKLGVSPQIRDRYRDSSVYWVDFELQPDQVIDASDYQASPSRVLRLEGRECPAPG